MSFKCQNCKNTFPNKNKPDEYRPERVVIKTRSYFGDESGRVEIARELELCLHCALVAKQVGPQHDVVKVSHDQQG